MSATMRFAGGIVATIGCFAFASSLLAAAQPTAAREHPAIHEVLDMVDGFVASEVIVERVRRMPEVPALADSDLVALAEHDVPERVVLELLRKRRVADACPQRADSAVAALGAESGLKGKEVLKHPSVVEVLRRLDAGESSQVVIERIQELRRMPLLDGGALRKLTSKGIPDGVLSAMIRKQSAPRDCEDPCAALLEAARAPAPALVEEIERRAGGGLVVEEIESCALRVPVAPSFDDAATERLRALGISDAVLLELARKTVVVTPSAPPIAAQAVVPAVAIHDSELPATRVVVAQSAASDPSMVPVAAARAETKPQVAEAALPLADRIGSGRVQVVAETSLPVTFVSVLLDGVIVARQGEIHQGQVSGGWQLPPPVVLDCRRGTVVFERDLPAGSYALETEFALSKVVKFEWDATMHTWGERYDTASAGPESLLGDKPVCEVRDGQVCIVRAKLVKRGDDYAVTYQTKVR